MSNVINLGETDPIVKELEELLKLARAKKIDGLITVVDFVEGRPYHSITGGFSADEYDQYVYAGICRAYDLYFMNIVTTTEDVDYD